MAPCGTKQGRTEGRGHINASCCAPAHMISYTAFGVSIYLRPSFGGRRMGRFSRPSRALIRDGFEFSHNAVESSLTQDLCLVLSNDSRHPSDGR